MANFKQFIKNIILYRAGGPSKEMAFWTPDIEYAKYIHPNKIKSIHKAIISTGAHILKKNTSANKTDIAKAKIDGYDIIVFPAWDWNTDEYVVLNNKALIIS